METEHKPEREPRYQLLRCVRSVHFLSGSVVTGRVLSVLRLAVVIATVGVVLHVVVEVAQNAVPRLSRTEQTIELRPVLGITGITDRARALLVRTVTHLVDTGDD